MPPDSGRLAHHSGAALYEPQATSERKRGRRGGRRRGKGAATVRRINAVADDRNAIWAGRGERAAVEASTKTLDGLYVTLREARKGDLGEPFRGRSASYVSPPSQSPRSWRGEQ
jgi:hypothetical protein